MWTEEGEDVERLPIEFSVLLFRMVINNIWTAPWAILEILLFALPPASRVRLPSQTDTQ